jgi:uncharacterized Zn finger protein (UPF0148 family)
MSVEIVKIKCPECGAVLRVGYQPGIETKNVVCPVCKHTHRFNEYKVWHPKQQEDTTETASSSNKKPGRLIDVSTGKSYQLVSGVNTIGRKAPSSSATIQIDTSDRYMSRTHVEINFDSFHYFRILSEKNQTTVNGQTLKMGDCIILYGGEELKLANTVLRFEQEEDDEDKTSLSL